MPTSEILAERYRLIRPLGRGGMGQVWAAGDEVLGREVAIKVLNVVHAPADALSRFRREARLLAALAHPHIVTVFDFGADAHRAWLVMELLGGPTLDALITDSGPLPVTDVATYGRDCASALAAAHAVDVVHRDIKPANLMLAADGRCMLVDLGIARLVETTGTTQAALTQTGMIVGTAPYVAPELVEGGSPTSAVDTYALGAVLFTLITGHPPYRAETPLLTLAQHVQAPVPRPGSERPEIPGALDQLVVDLLAKDPATRPSAADAAQRLDALVSADAAEESTIVLPTGSEAPTRVIGPPSPTRLMEPTTRARVSTRRGLLAGAAALVLIVLLAIWLASALTGGSPPPASAARSSPPTTTTSTPPPSTSATSSGSPIDVLRTAVQQAAATGGLSPAVATDLSRRVSDLSRGIDSGQQKDFAHQLNDFDHRLRDAHKKGDVSDSAFQQIEAALSNLRGGDSEGD